MKKVRLYIRYDFDNSEFRICDELTDEVYAQTGVKGLAPIIKESLESFMNANRAKFLTNEHH